MQFSLQVANFPQLAPCADGIAPPIPLSARSLLAESHERFDLAVSSPWKGRLPLLVESLDVNVIAGSDDFDVLSFHRCNVRAIEGHSAGE